MNKSKAIKGLSKNKINHNIKKTQLGQITKAFIKTYKHNKTYIKQYIENNNQIHYCAQHIQAYNSPHHKPKKQSQRSGRVYFHTSQTTFNELLHSTVINQLTTLLTQYYTTKTIPPQHVKSTLTVALAKHMTLCIYIDLLANSYKPAYLTSSLQTTSNFVDGAIFVQICV